MSFKVEKIGIALAAYKPHPQYFLEQLLSIRNQSFTNWICIVSFDSDPSEFEKASDFESIWSDSRFKIKKNSKQLGAKLNFQAGIREVLKHNVDAFACSDQDDIWFPNKLELSKDELVKRGGQSLVHTDMTVMYEVNGQWKDRERTAWQIEKRGINNVKPTDFLIRNIVAGAAMLVDIELAEKYPVIPDAFPFHDHWYAFVASCFGGVYPLPLPLYRYRQHSNNVLGVRQHRGLISVRDKPWNVMMLKEKLKSKYLWSLELAKAAEASGLLKGQAVAFVEQNLISYVSTAAKCFSEDPALARALLARSLGQLL